ncbi:MAG: 3-deoxy-D-manno-octulosonic acid transferase [Kiritimatiellia bacterium]
MWMIYNILFVFVYILLLPHFFVRMRRRGGYRQHFGERFGRYDATKEVALLESGRIWVHAVSVGEAQLALALIQVLREEDPSLRFVVSTTTSTGYSLIATRKQDVDVLIYYPLDFPWIVNRVLAKIRPRALLLLECELWPNLLRGMSQRGIPVWVINGRISERSFRGYRKIAFLFRRTACLVKGFLVQTDGDAERLRLLGAENVCVLGSAKFDVPLPGPMERERALAVIEQAGMNPAGMFWVMGSTWPGEEEELVRVFQVLRERYCHLQAILVPRHAERGDAIAAALDRIGIAYVRRSKLSGTAPPGERPVLLLADSTGELTGYYMLADFVFVGKSLAGNHGGQNPVEAAALGKAVVVGENMENFGGVMADLVSADAIGVVRDFAELVVFAERCASDAGFRTALGQRAREVVASRRGVMRKSAHLVMQHLREAKR